MAIGTQHGTTYYSDLRNTQSISAPIVGNDVQMTHKGSFAIDWDKYTVDFDNFGYGLKKNRYNQGGIYCPDASKLFSLRKGYVGMVLSFPRSFHGGKYYPLINSEANVKEHLLWGVNVGKIGSSVPTVFARLTEVGIEFVVWSSYVRYSLIDKFSKFSANSNIFMEFIWDGDGFAEYSNENGYKPTMCLRMNSEDILVGNPPIADNSIENLNFYVLETPSVYSNLECTIRRLVIGNGAPHSIEEEWYSSSSSSGISEDRESSISSDTDEELCSVRLDTKGGDEGYSKTFDISSDGTFVLTIDEFKTYNIKDRLIILADDVSIYDSGCIATNETGIISGVDLDIYSSYSSLTVVVEPNCDGRYNTLWVLRLSCKIIVDAKNCVHFRWADLDSDPGPYGEDDNDIYGPTVVSVPEGATKISISAEGLWTPYDGYDWVDPDGVGSGGIVFSTTTLGDYNDALYNSQNIPLAGYYDHGWLIGFWSDGSSATGAINGTIYQVGSSWSNQSIPNNATEIALGFHDGYNWTDCEGSVKVDIVWHYD